MVDIDPLGCGGEGGAAVCAEAFRGGAVEGDDEIDVDGVGAGLADAVGSWEEGEGRGDGVFVEEDDLFAEGFEGHADGEGGAEGVAVWSEVREDGAGRGGVAGRGDGVEGSVGAQGHGVVGGSRGREARVASLGGWWLRLVRVLGLGGGFEGGGFGELAVDGFHDAGDADPAFDAGVEVEVETRRVFEDDAAADAGLVFAVALVEGIDDVLGFVFRADDADEDLTVFEVRGEFDVVDGDEDVWEGVVSSDHGPQLALEELAHADLAVLHSGGTRGR